MGPFILSAVVGQTAPDAPFVPVTTAMHSTDIGSGTGNKRGRGKQESREDSGFTSRLGCFGRLLLRFLEALLGLGAELLGLLLRVLNALFGLSADLVGAIYSLINARIDFLLRQTRARGDLLAQERAVLIRDLARFNEVHEDTANLTLHGFRIVGRSRHSGHARLLLAGTQQSIGDIVNRVGLQTLREHILQRRSNGIARTLHKTADRLTRAGNDTAGELTRTLGDTADRSPRRFRHGAGRTAHGLCPAGNRAGGEHAADQHSKAPYRKPVNTVASGYFITHGAIDPPPHTTGDITAEHVDRHHGNHCEESGDNQPPQADPAAIAVIDGDGSEPKARRECRHHDGCPARDDCPCKDRSPVHIAPTGIAGVRHTDLFHRGGHQRRPRKERMNNTMTTRPTR